MDQAPGIAEADAHLGVRFPLPRLAVPLVRWVEVRTVGAGAEVEWNLDDSRPGTPGRLALYAGREAPAEQLPADAQATTRDGMRILRAPLPEAQVSLRPVCEVRWQAGDLQLRLTAQGPWELSDILALVRSVA